MLSILRRLFVINLCLLQLLQTRAQLGGQRIKLACLLNGNSLQRLVRDIQ